MLKQGKKYQEVAKLVEKDKLYDPEEAIALIKTMGTAKFDETVEIANEEHNAVADQSDPSQCHQLCAEVNRAGRGSPLRGNL